MIYYRDKKNTELGWRPEGITLIDLWKRKSWWATTLFDYKIDDKVYTEYSAEFQNEVNKQITWHKLCGQN